MCIYFVTIRQIPRKGVCFSEVEKMFVIFVVITVQVAQEGASFVDI